MGGSRRSSTEYQNSRGWIPRRSRKEKRRSKIISEDGGGSDGVNIVFKKTTPVGRRHRSSSCGRVGPNTWQQTVDEWQAKCGSQQRFQQVIFYEWIHLGWNPDEFRKKCFGRRGRNYSGLLSNSASKSTAHDGTRLVGCSHYQRIHDTIIFHRMSSVI